MPLKLMFKKSFGFKILPFLFGTLVIAVFQFGFLFPAFAGKGKILNVCADFGAAKEVRPTKITHYFAAVNPRQHRSIEGAPWVGSGRSPLLACKSVAADPKFHPYGSELYIDAIVGLVCRNRDGSTAVADGKVVVIDTGSAIKGQGRFDFFAGGCEDVNTRSNMCNDIMRQWEEVQRKVREDGGISYCVLKKGTGNRRQDFSPDAAGNFPFGKLDPSSPHSGQHAKNDAKNDPASPSADSGKGQKKPKDSKPLPPGAPPVEVPNAAPSPSPTPGGFFNRLFNRN